MNRPGIRGGSIPWTRMESMGRPSKYPTSSRQRAVRMVFEWREARGVTTGGVNEVAAQLGVNPETLRNWLKQVEVDTGLRPGTTTEDKARIAELERENRELRRANEILKSASAFRGGARPPTEVVTLHRGASGPVRGRADLRASWQVAPSTYYAARKRRRRCGPLARGADACRSCTRCGSRTATSMEPTSCGRRPPGGFMTSAGTRSLVSMREPGDRGVSRGKAKRSTNPATPALAPARTW